MDKTWMKADRRSIQFRIGLERFLKFALDNAQNPHYIFCPCVKCCNISGGSIQFIKDHVICNGMMESYINWIWHGECSVAASINVPDESSQTVEMDNNIGIDVDESDRQSVESDEFMTFVQDGDKPLYPGCTKATKMNGLIQTFNLKAKHGLTESCYTDLLVLLHTLLPDGNEMPNSANSAKKCLSALGMKYEKIDACPNDCILYRGPNKNDTRCPSCNASRWKLDRNNLDKEGVAAKTLWYFPPIPRFRRMYQSTVSAKALTWHSTGRKKDGLMRHPADSPTWEMIDTKWEDFGTEPRNLRLGLSSDGFNPFGTLSSTYSCWPVIMVIYNLPPWLCMKRKYMMLTLLISGPKQPGNDIDVYLQPLIDDLKVLWNEGIEGVYDSVRGEYFRLRAILLWTINDFPAYGNLSGSIVKGYNACPICIDQTKPLRLKHSKKMSFGRTRRWTARNHPYRKQASAFDNTIERDDAPKPLSGEELYERVKCLPRASGKGVKSVAYKGPPECRPCWKKRSVFYDLDYWKFLEVKHNVDIMHLEKNCAEAIIGTLLNIPGKTKDGIAARLDMVDMGIRDDLKPATGEKRDKLPMSACNLFDSEQKIVCNSFYNMKAPSYFSSNIRTFVSLNESKIGNLKSHDCHVIMQLLLPIALRSVLDKPVRIAIIRFCLFFKSVCSKVIDVSLLQKVQSDLVDTLCLLEKFFPPAFFDVMVHLTLHLVREVELCGPVLFRWMYPFERYMKVFKGMVHNRQFPEGCIAECYILEEAVEFLQERMGNEDSATIGLPRRNIKGLVNGCKPLSAPTLVKVGSDELHLAHLTILQNSEDVQPYFMEHMNFLQLSYPYQKDNPKWLRDKQNSTFPEWLNNRVNNEILLAPNEVSETVRWLAGGPNTQVPTFQGYHINGVDFNTIERDVKRAVQNSGVYLVADAMQVASAKDKKPKTADMNFYGRIKQIWEMDYYKFRVPIFLCDWVESSRGVKVDELGFTLVKLGRMGHLNDPFVLATHANQIFYIEDPLDAEWSVVVMCPDKSFKGGDEDGVGDMDDDYYDEDNRKSLEEQPYIPTFPEVDIIDNGDPVSYARPGDEGIWVDK